jgi:UDP-N-acetylmuramate dehydrogenase
MPCCAWHAGLENLALIPAVASSPIQNIGAYGVELQRVCEYVDCIELATGKHLRVSATECRFGYVTASSSMNTRIVSQL